MPMLTRFHTNVLKAYLKHEPQRCLTFLLSSHFPHLFHIFVRQTELQIPKAALDTFVAFMEENGADESSPMRTILAAIIESKEGFNSIIDIQILLRLSCMKILITPADLSLLLEIPGLMDRSTIEALKGVDLKSDFDVYWLEVRLRSIPADSAAEIEAPKEIVRAFNSMSEKSAEQSITVFDYYRKFKRIGALCLSEPFRDYVDAKLRLAIEMNKTNFRNLLNLFEAAKLCRNLASDIDQSISRLVMLIYEDCHAKRLPISPFPGFSVEFVASFVNSVGPCPSSVADAKYILSTAPAPVKNPRILKYFRLCAVVAALPPGYLFLFFMRISGVLLQFFAHDPSLEFAALFSAFLQTAESANVVWMVECLRKYISNVKYSRRNWSRETEVAFHLLESCTAQMHSESLALRLKTFGPQGSYLSQS
jgi:hypothetical protein